MPTKKTLARFAIIIVILTVAGYAIWFATRPAPIEVELATIKRSAVEATVVNTRAGTVTACRRAKLAPAAGGQIVKLLAKEGDRVKKGQVLLELWNTDLTAQRDLAWRQFITAEERRREACIIAAHASREAERARQLAERGFVSAQNRENADADARARQASCDATTADVKRARAQVEVTEAGLERTVLAAPFDGIVALVTGELGEYTTPSPPGIPTPPAIDLIDDSCLYVTAPMDEVDAPKLRIGQLARITIDALPGQTFPGKVRRVAPYVTEVEKQARTVDIEVDFEEIPERPLLVGYSADVEVVIERHENVLRVPTQTIRQGGKVLLVNEENRLVEHKLETGLANWAFTEVTGGLKEGDRVLLSSEAKEIKAGMQAREKVAEQ